MLRHTTPPARKRRTPTYPRTMVVHLQHTHVAQTAVMRSVRLVHVTPLAVAFLSIRFRLEAVGRPVKPRVRARYSARRHQRAQEVVHHQHRG